MSRDALPVTPEEARRLLDVAATRHILVVGDCMLDRYVTGSVERISPEAPVPVLRVEEERYAPGGAANVAIGVTALGARCSLVGVVGVDPEGERLAGLLRERGVDASHLVRDGGRPTTVKTRILARHQQILRVDREAVQPVAGGLRAELSARALAALERADVLVMEDYDKGTLEPGVGRQLLATARRRRVPSVVDPKLRHFFELRGATLFKPNGRELAAALGVESAPRDASTLAALLGRLECEHLLVTLGEEGMLLATSGESRIRLFPSRAREVFDVTGAGDTVTAAVAVLLAAGAEPGTVASLGNLAAGIEVSRLGAVPVTREELLEEVERAAGGRQEVAPLPGSGQS